MKDDLGDIACSNHCSRTRRTAGLRGCERRVHIVKGSQTVFAEQLEPRALGPAIGRSLQLADVTGESAGRLQRKGLGQAFA